MAQPPYKEIDRFKSETASQNFPSQQSILAIHQPPRPFPYGAKPRPRLADLTLHKGWASKNSAATFITDIT